MTDHLTVYLGADHEGLDDKEAIRHHLERSLTVIDCGTHSSSPVDYPEIAQVVARKVAEDPLTRRGILVCASGIGMVMTANRIHGCLAGQVWSVDQAKRSRHDDNLNVLCLASAYTPLDQMIPVIDAWLAEPFSGIERHLRRVSEVEHLQ